MPRRIASADLARFFAQIVDNDFNATLKTARHLLRRAGEPASGESASRLQEWFQEMDELIQVHGEACPLSEFLPDPGLQAEAGPGVHG